LQSRPHRQTDVPVRAHVTVTVTHSSVSSSVTADDVIVTSRDTVLRHDYTSLETLPSSTAEQARAPDSSQSAVHCCEPTTAMRNM